MKMKSTLLNAAVVMACGSIAPVHAIVVTPNENAAALAGAIAGPGITFSNPTLTFTGDPAGTNRTGTFSGGTGSIGFASGIVLTTGTTDCVPGPNSSESCSGDGVSASLKFDFTSTTGNVFFSYVFGSEEYNEFVGSPFNDRFELRLDGTNIAQLPGGAGVVSINNVNCGTNSAFYRNNSDLVAPAGCVNLGLDIQYDGLTTVLTASATGLAAGTHTFEFFVTDITDDIYDSGVFIQAGSFASSPGPGPGPGPGPIGAPEPGSLVLLGAGLAALAALRRRKTH